MALTQAEVQDIVKGVSDQAAIKISADLQAIETRLNQQAEEFQKGALTKTQFETVQAAAATESQKILNSLQEMRDAMKAQSDVIDEIKGQTPVKVQAKSIKEFVAGQTEKLKQLRSAGVGFIEFTQEDLKAAGVTSIAGTIDPASPYMPGISDTPLQLFDIVRDANFMINRVDVANTTSPLLAWVNELAMEGDVGMDIQESGLKPMISHKYRVETSKPKKAAAHMVITEEFAEDVEQLYNDMRTVLQTDVIRAFDDQIQYDVFDKAIPWNLSGLLDEIQDANLWDAVYALITQPGVYNFDTNTVAYNWMTNAKVNMGKDNTAAYLLPPFIDEINRLLVRANKIPTNSAIAGDLKQYHVRILKGYTFKMGWINEQFIHNEFSILGEIRYHSYISDNRRYAIAKGDLNNIRTLIDGTPGS